MTVDEWMRGRVPPVPVEFRPWVARALATAPASEAELIREARSALARAAAGLGERKGAFDLLVADALASWAAESVLGEDGAEGGLEEMVRALAR